jgi:hypothetical protein
MGIVVPSSDQVAARIGTVIAATGSAGNGARGAEGQAGGVKGRGVGLARWGGVVVLNGTR